MSRATATANLPVVKPAAIFLERGTSPTWSSPTYKDLTCTPLQGVGRDYSKGKCGTNEKKKKSSSRLAAAYGLVESNAEPSVDALAV
jgi:hypothetical protein